MSGFLRTAGSPNEPPLVYDAAMRFFVRPDGRVYTVFPPAQDLIGDWVVLTIHGRKGTRRGGLHSYVASDQAAAAKLEARIAGIRVRHGYQEQSAVG